MTRARILADYVSGGTTAAEFDYLDGVTSNIQTQLTAKAPLASPAFTGSPSITLGSDATGDVYYRAAGGALTRLATGADGTVLTSTGVGAVPAFEAISAGVAETTGTWDPENGGGSEAWTTTSNASFWVKHGVLIHVFGNFEITGGTGEYMNIAGLPVAQTSGKYATSTVMDKAYISGGYVTHVRTAPSSTVLSVRNTTLGSQAYGSGFANGRVTFLITYEFAT